MTKIPTDNTTEHAYASLDFWLKEARLMKETAELSWEADLNAMQRVKLMYNPQHDRVIRHATEELGVELNLLYRYLISLAIQYLAIGLLIHRDPQYFLNQPPGHKIVSLLQASDVEMSAQQQELLGQIEHAYEWAERYPVGQLGGAHDELRQLTHQLSQMDCLALDEKRSLDGLYTTLESRARQLTQ